MFITFIQRLPGNHIKRTWRSFSAALLAATAISLVAQPASAKPKDWVLFGTAESSYDDISAFKKWTSMLERYPAQRAEQEKLCKQQGRRAACVLTGWMKKIEEFRTLPKSEQVNAVNSYLNEMPYIEDIVNWGMEDFWATPIEFLQRSGDCEDYAIAKYKSLRLLGFTPEELRIVVLNDLNLNVLHAVLGVKVDGRYMILDNQIKQTVESRRVFHYQPIYSINEDGWWRHVQGKY
jgi:predicted transglutaminase-like cysteine proteinase